MTAASTATFHENKPVENTRITKEMVTQWVKQYGPITMHDLYDKLRATGAIARSGRSQSNKEQGWNEFLSRLGVAARLGMVDDSKKVRHAAGSKSSWRTLYKFISDVPTGDRGTKVGQLRRRIFELEEELKALKASMPLRREPITKERLMDVVRAIKEMNNPYSYSERSYFDTYTREPCDAFAVYACRSDLQPLLKVDFSFRTPAIYTADRHYANWHDDAVLKWFGLTRSEARDLFLPPTCRSREAAIKDFESFIKEKYE